MVVENLACSYIVVVGFCRDFRLEVALNLLLRLSMIFCNHLVERQSSNSSIRIISLRSQMSNKCSEILLQITQIHCDITLIKLSLFIVLHA